MINFSTLILSSEISGPGGLFDINATLPLVAIQFVILMLVLNVILYGPLLTIIEVRNKNILDDLGKAAEFVDEANILTAQYDEQIANVRKKAQLEITNAQKIHKEILDLEINNSQQYLDTLLDTITTDFENKKTSALNNLEYSVQSLCYDINQKFDL